jgi:hypothetical protein
LACLLLYFNWWFCILTSYFCMNLLE